MRTKTPRASSSSRSARARSPPPTSMATKLVADGSATRPSEAARRAYSSAGRHLRDHPRHELRVAERGERPDLRDPAHPEVVADLVEPGHEVAVPDAVADARSRQPVRLGEGAKAEHARVPRFHRPVGASRGEIDVRLVERDHDVLGKRLDKPPDPLRAVPGAHRVVGVGEVHERCPGLADRLRQGIRILVVVAVGHGHQARAEPRDLVVEGRVGPGRRHHRRARVGQHPHDESEELVDSGPEAHLLQLHPVMRGEGRPQVVPLRIAVQGDVPERLAHGLRHARRDPQGALVRADPRFEGTADPALDGFRTDEGKGGGELPHDGAERNHGQAAGSREGWRRRIRGRRGGRGGGADRGRRARAGARCRPCATGR